MHSFTHISSFNITEKGLSSESTLYFMNIRIGLCCKETDMWLLYSYCYTNQFRDIESYLKLGIQHMMNVDYLLNDVKSIK